VEIEKFEASSGRYAISAVIWVERENQRAILLGKGGEAIKQAASAARQSMIDFFQTRVHLDVWIKVKKNWSSEEATLVQLGYTD
jgi:GTP-binding protein Era